MPLEGTHTLAAAAYVNPCLWSGPTLCCCPCELTCLWREPILCCLPSEPCLWSGPPRPAAAVVNHASGGDPHPAAAHVNPCLWRGPTPCCCPCEPMPLDGTSSPAAAHVKTHSILTSEFLFYILSSEQSAYFLQFVQLEVQTYTFLCPLLQHEEKRRCTLSSLSN